MNSYAHSLCFVVFYCILLVVSFTHFIHIYFTFNTLQIAMGQYGELNFWSNCPKTDVPHVLYKIPLAQTNFLLAWLKIYPCWQAGGPCWGEAILKIMGKEIARILHELKMLPQQNKHTEPRHYIDGLVQERHNSSALAMELHLSCINPSSHMLIL